MTFFQRVHNVFINFASNFLIETVYVQIQDEIYHVFFPDSKNCLSKVRQNVSLVLSNSHPLLRFASPQMTNFIEVGGLHLKKSNLTKIPERILNFIESASDGVIYFSLGSTKGSDPTGLPRKTFEAILEGFGRLSRKVLFKCNSDLSNLEIPKNVFLSNWFPQESILAHPKVKLFITHGGKGGLYEAMYYGVPIVGIPLGCDNYQAITKLVEEGFGISIDLDILTSNLLENSVNFVLSNDTFQHKADAISKAFRDYPIDPLETTVQWIEHVIKHKGLIHMKSKAPELGFVQYFSLDVILFVAGLICLVVYGVLDMIKTNMNRKLKTV